MLQIGSPFLYSWNIFMRTQHIKKHCTHVRMINFVLLLFKVITCVTWVDVMFCAVQHHPLVCKCTLTQRVQLITLCIQQTWTEMHIRAWTHAWKHSVFCVFRLASVSYFTRVFIFTLYIHILSSLYI